MAIPQGKAFEMIRQLKDLPVLHHCEISIIDDGENAILIQPKGTLTCQSGQMRAILGIVKGWTISIVTMDDNKAAIIIW